MNEYSFTLKLDASPLSDEQIRSLYDVLPEVTISERDGNAFIELDTDGRTFAHAVVEAIERIERVPAGVRVVALEPEELMFASEIAQRTGRSKEGVSLLIEGRRGPGAFPAPAHTLTGGQKLWRWADVEAWFRSYEDGAEMERHDAVIAAINGILAARETFPLVPEAERTALQQLARDADLVTA